MPTAKKSTKKKKPKVYKYNLSITVNGEEHTSKGDTMQEAIDQFEVPNFIKSMVVVRGKTEDKDVEMMYNGREAQRLFANHGSVSLLASNLEKRLG